MYYELGYMSLCQNRSTYLNTYFEQGYFELITGQTCQHESKKFISRVIANQFIFAQNCVYWRLTCKKCTVFMWLVPITSFIVNSSYNLTILTKEKTIHGNRFHVFWNNWCINYLLANDVEKSWITSKGHPHQDDTPRK